MKKIVRRIVSLIGPLAPGSRKRKLRHPLLSDSMVESIRAIFDAKWYGTQYPHVIRAHHDPFKHFIWHGIKEGLAPNAFFLTPWYLDKYRDVAATDMPPIIHYLKHGAVEGRDPHPDFDAAWYVSQHPKAKNNPLLYHMKFGRQKGWHTRKSFTIEGYLPVCASLPTPPEGLVTDIIVPVYRGLAETRRCLESVLADSRRPAGRIIVIDDCSPELELSQWLDELAASDSIHLLRNDTNLGFVRSVNRGMLEAGRNDVVLLNSDTQVPEGWLSRLAGHAWSGKRTGTVTPFSNNATICSYPTAQGAPLPEGYDLQRLDDAFRQANPGRSIPIPTAVGFCMYIRRDCLDEVGLFDAKAFGRGYGEENDFCMRASARGWEHLHACDTYVFHEGEVSFGRNTSLLDQARNVLLARYPDYPRLINRYLHADPAAPSRFAASAMLLRQSGLPVILFITHGMGGGTERHIQDLIKSLKGKAECLILRPNVWGCDLFFPGIPGLSSLSFAANYLSELAPYLRACTVRRIHIHHQVGYDDILHDLVRESGLPFDLTIHDYYPVCPQINLISSVTDRYCGEPDASICNICIAQSPVHGATDIASWRLRHRWMFENAERVLCPTHDTMVRLKRMGMSGAMMVVPHEPVQDLQWPDVVQSMADGQTMRVAILGTLVAHKGIDAVQNTVLAAGDHKLEFILIGSSEPMLTMPEGSAYSETGFYRDGDLQKLIQQQKPHVIWFPVLCPETYSYTLSAAIMSGLPIIASNLGAFPERLAQYPKSILVPPTVNAETWLTTFALARGMMQKNETIAVPAPHHEDVPFYPQTYLAPINMQQDPYNKTTPAQPESEPE